MDHGVESEQKRDKAPLTGDPGGPIIISCSSGWSLSVSFSSLYNHPNTQPLLEKSSAITLLLDSFQHCVTSKLR